VEFEGKDQTFRGMVFKPKNNAIMEYTMLEELLMAELLCTRLCHDLTGPIGAVNNGAEFLAEEGFNLQGQAVELITSSAFSAVTRLQFYRMSYGKVRDHGEASLEEKQKLAVDFFSDTKTKLDWPDNHTDSVNVSISLKMSRLIYNMLIVASSVLVRGGVIAVRIAQDDKNNKVVTVDAKGTGLKWDEEIDVIFAGKLTPLQLTPKNVQTYLTKRFIDDLGAAFTYKIDAETLHMKILQATAN
jgi:histidine phosphotransferase ChpT